MKYTLLSTLIMSLFTITTLSAQPSTPDSIVLIETSTEQENPPINETPDMSTDSSVVDNLDFFDAEITAEEFMQQLSELISSIINNQTVISKEALQAYIAHQVVRIISTHNIRINVSLTRKKTPTPQGPPNQKALDIVNNIAGLVSNVCCAIKEQRAQNTPQLTNHLEGICSNIINIAMIATH